MPAKGRDSQSKEFRDAREAAEAKARAEQAEHRHRSRTPADRESRTEATRLVRAETRYAKLDELTPDRVCPCCGEVVLESRKWVVLDEARRRAAVDALRKAEFRDRDGETRELTPEERERLEVLVQKGCCCRGCAMRLLGGSLWFVRRGAGNRGQPS